MNARPIVHSSHGRQESFLHASVKVGLVQSSKSHLKSFLRSAHRRMVWRRLLERMGIALLMGCGASLLVGSVLLWHGHGVSELVEVLLGIAVFGGVLSGIVRRPTLLQTALEVDRQTHSAELFSSALVVDSGWWMVDGETPAGGFAGAVVTAAEAKCGDRAMSDVKFGRFGGRAWGGIGLAVALVVTMVMLGPASVQHHETDAEVATNDHSKSSNVEAGKPPDASFMSMADNRPVILPDPDDLNSNTFGQNEKSAAEKSQGSTGIGEQSDARASDQDSNNDGTKGTGRTKMASDNAKPKLAEHALGTGNPESNNGTMTANGSGAPSSASPPDDGKVSKTANGRAVASALGHSANVPPWRSSNWRAQVELAHKAIDGGRVPAVYRDLIRDYFSPEAISPAFHD